MPLTSEQKIARARETVRAEAQAVQALAEQLDDGLLPVLQVLFGCRGHVLVTGAGTSAATAQRFAHLLSCCGTPALFVSAGDSQHGGAGAITPNDVVFVISKGGQSADLVTLADLAHARGARIVVQTEAPQSPLAQKADVVYKVVTEGEVDLYGMIALGSSLVHAAAGDAMCAVLLEMRGYTLEQFGVTHPGGAVGRRLAEEHGHS